MAKRQRPMEGDGSHDNLRQEAPVASASQGRRSRRDELEDRLDIVEGWLVQRLRRAEVVKLCAKRWRVSVRQADRYLQQVVERRRAREAPAREETLRLHLDTLDAAIAECFRGRKWIALIGLLKLRAQLDGSLVKSPPVQATPTVERPPIPSMSDDELLEHLRNFKIQIEEFEKFKEAQRQDAVGESASEGEPSGWDPQRYG